MFNSKLIKILKEEVILQKEIIKLQNSLIDISIIENQRLIEVIKSLTKKENTTENNVFLDSRNKTGNLSVKGNVVVEGKI